MASLKSFYAAELRKQDEWLANQSAFHAEQYRQHFWFTCLMIASVVVQNLIVAYFLFWR
jgi:hypothetical protein